MRFRTPQLIPSLFIITACITLATMGTWQLQRLQWKNVMIASIEAAQSQPALTKLPDDISTLAYRNVELTGTFINGAMMRRAGGIEGERSGFFIQTPFKLAEDTRTILVNRGFAPDGKEGTPAGKQIIKGILRPPRGKNMFVPNNQPEKNIWFYEDMEHMSRTAKVELQPLVVEIVGKRQPGVYPVPNNGKIKLRNDHLHYAITWFSILLIGLVMFAIYHRIPENKA